MRRYQRKLVNEVATYYQSNDPLRWVFIAVKLNVDRQPSERERKLFARRVRKTVEHTAEQLVARMSAFAEAVRNMGVSLKQMTDNIKANMKEEESA